MFHSEKEFRAAKRRQGASPALAHHHDFDVQPWKPTVEMLEWERDNIDNSGSKHSNVLVIVGPPRCGKTEWAMSFGRPIEMGPRLKFKKMDKTGWTHLVVNDLHGGPHLMRALAKEMAKRRGKCAGQHPMDFSKPVIFTFDQDNKFWNNESFRGYLSDSGAVIVKVSRKLY